METKKTGKVNIIISIALVIIAIALAALTFYFFRQYQNIKKNPNQVAQAEIDAVVANVGRIIDLPKDETPTLATVQDKDKLKDQPFFAMAENGDKILIYTKAKKAIIYRSKENKLVNVGPIVIDPKTLPQLAIVDAGGDVNGVVKKISDKFADNVSIASSATAKSKNSVKQITVLDITGKSGELASQIASEIGGTVSNTYPAGETVPDGANIVIFVK
jgi:heme/copper-type cytochrome/quinol oxidase subunit 2